MVSMAEEEMGAGLCLDVIHVQELSLPVRGWGLKRLLFTSQFEAGFICRLVRTQLYTSIT